MYLCVTIHVYVANVCMCAYEDFVCICIFFWCVCMYQEFLYEEVRVEDFLGVCMCQEDFSIVLFWT